MEVTSIEQSKWLKEFFDRNSNIKPESKVNIVWNPRDNRHVGIFGYKGNNEFYDENRFYLFFNPTDKPETEQLNDPEDYGGVEFYCTKCGCILYNDDDPPLVNLYCNCSEWDFKGDIEHYQTKNILFEPHYDCELYPAYFLEDLEKVLPKQIKYKKRLLKLLIDFVKQDSHEKIYFYTSMKGSDPKLVPDMNNWYDNSFQNIIELLKVLEEKRVFNK